MPAPLIDGIVQLCLSLNNVQTTRVSEIIINLKMSKDLLEFYYAWN